MHELGAFLDAAAARRFAWGQFDCALFVADWISTRTGIDGAADLRGRYATRAECTAVLDSLGGLIAVVDERAMRCGMRFQKTAEVAPGDIGIVTMAEEVDGVRSPGTFAAIYVGEGRWATLGVRGLLIAPARPLAAWTL